MGRCSRSRGTRRTVRRPSRCRPCRGSTTCRRRAPTRTSSRSGSGPGQPTCNSSVAQTAGSWRLRLGDGMATIQRPVKEGSGPNRTYQEKVGLGFVDILASEMDGDIDTIYAAWNGGASTINIKDGAVTLAKLATDAKLWTDTGTALTPTTASRPLVLPAANLQFQVGSGTIKGQFEENTAGGLWLHTNYAWGPQDATKSSWTLNLDAPSDIMQFFRRAPGAAAASVTTPLVLSGAGDCVLTGKLIAKNYCGAIITGTVQTIGSGVAAVCNLDTAWFASPLNFHGSQQIVVDRDGPCLLWGMGNFSAAAANLGISLEVQQWNGSTFAKVGSSSSRWDSQFGVTTFVPAWNSSYRNFRLVCTNATGASIAANFFFALMY